MTWLPSFLTNVKGFDPVKTANFMVAFYLGLFVGMWIWGLISDKIGKKLSLILCFALIAAILPVYLRQQSPLALSVIGFIFAFFFAFSNLMAPVFTGMYPTEIRATGSGFCFHVGRGISSIAPTLLGIISVAKGLQYALGFCTIFFAVACILTFLIPYPIRKSQEMGHAEKVDREYAKTHA